jgi:hypothetical protein
VSTGLVLPTRLPLEELAEATFLRICSTAWAAKEPGFRASGLFRFDDPRRTFETLYVASAFKTCFFETVVRDKMTVPPDPAKLAERSVVVLTVATKELKLVKLHGTGAQQLKLNAAQLMSEGYTFTQELARSIHEHPDQPDGMVYRSRFDDDQLALVLFGRAAEKVRLFPGSRTISLDQTPELVMAACRYML